MASYINRQFIRRCRTLAPTTKASDSWPKVDDMTPVISTSTSYFCMLSFFHAVRHHLERHDMNLIFIGIHVRGERDVMSFVAFDRIRVADGPALAVFVVYKHLPVVADFARNFDRLGRRVGLHVVLLHGVLSHCDTTHNQAKREANCH